MEVVDISLFNNNVIIYEGSQFSLLVIILSSIDESATKSDTVTARKTIFWKGLLPRKIY